MLKSISSVLVISQLALGIACATPVLAATTATPEMQMLESVIALQGQNLSNEEMAANLNAAVSRYQATASTDGESERMEQALVQLNVFTPEQAASYVSAVQAQSNALANHQTTTSQAIQTLAGSAFAGAQYSTRCTIGILGVVSGAGLLALICDSGTWVGPSNAIGFGLEMGSLGALGLGLLIASVPSECM